MAKKKTAKKKTKKKVAKKTGTKKKTTAKRPGLWANIQKKKARIKKGSGEKMRKAGDDGAPTSKSLTQSKS